MSSGFLVHFFTLKSEPSFPNLSWPDYEDNFFVQIFNNRFDLFTIHADYYTQEWKIVLTIFQNTER